MWVASEGAFGRFWGKKTLMTQIQGEKTRKVPHLSCHSTKTTDSIKISSTFPLLITNNCLSDCPLPIYCMHCTIYLHFI